ncbi:MAG: hypothetical protein JO250_12695 [Armatimonadetes bacterium]|nr:hypothetical protein [Armatimonadota bacterium]
MTRLLSSLPHLRTHLNDWVQSLQPHERNWALQWVEEIENVKITAIPLVFSFVFDRDQQVADEAWIVLTCLTARFQETGWRSLEPVMRSYAAEFPLGRLGPDDLEKLSRFGNRQSLLLGLASFHGNGYVREAAVRRLDASSDGELPFLLLRLNDWVEQVHRAALAACAARLTPENARQFVANLPYIESLVEAQRRDLRPFIQAVEELLMRPVCLPALLEGLSSSDSRTCRTCLRLALAASGEDTTLIFERAFRSNNPRLRLDAARALRSLPAGDPVQMVFLPRLSHDARASIRCEYLYLCHEKYPERTAWVLRNALLDPHPSVREAARYYLKLHEPMDFRLFYRAALGGPEVTSLAAVLAGLGETGQAEDTAVIAPFLHHSSADVRRAAVTAQGKLDGDNYVAQLLEALKDSRSRVSRAAREALLPRVFLIPDDALWAAWAGAVTPQAKKNALRLMLTLPQWRGGVLLVRACAAAAEQEDNDSAMTAQTLVQTWLACFNRSALSPTTEQLGQVKSVIEGSQASFGPEILAALQRILQDSERLTR